MAATPTAILSQLNGSSWATALPQVGGPAQNADIINIVDQGGNVILNVDYAGVVHNPASAATGINTRLVSTSLQSHQAPPQLSSQQPSRILPIKTSFKFSLPTVVA